MDDGTQGLRATARRNGLSVLGDKGHAAGTDHSRLQKFRGRNRTSCAINNTHALKKDPVHITGNQQTSDAHSRDNAMSRKESDVVITSLVVTSLASTREVAPESLTVVVDAAAASTT